MQEVINKRLQELKEERQVGQQQEQALQGQLGELRNTMLRINGAIQVLEELLDDDKPNEIRSISASQG